MSKLKRITIKDVARALNVAVSTVSRAFNDSHDIHPDTRQKILAKAKAMGYNPNPIARKLSTQQSGMIGVVVPEFLNAFFPKVLMGVQRVMNAEGYQVLVMSSDESAAKERENVATLYGNHIDGIIISLTQETRDVTFLRQLMENDVPVVQFNRVSQKLDTPKIIFDDYNWAFRATEHLIEQGYRHICHLAGNSSLVLSQLRRKGFQDAMRAHGLQADAGQIVEAGIFIADGRRAAEQLIDNDKVPEAFFCFNDPLAIGAMAVFRERGFDIPGQVAFIGFTESRIAPHTAPPLSSVEQPSVLMGEKAAEEMLRLLKGTKCEPKTITLSGELKIRASTVPLSSVSSLPTL